MEMCRCGDVEALKVSTIQLVQLNLASGCHPGAFFLETSSAFFSGNFQRLFSGNLKRLFI